MRITKPRERWFPVPGDPDEAQVKIKHLLPGEIQEIVDAAMVQEVEYRQHGEEMRPILRQINDQRKDREKTMLAAVRGWKNFYDEKDKPLQFSEPNVLRAMREIDGFIDFVGECREKIANDVEAEREAQEKN